MLYFRLKIIKTISRNIIWGIANNIYRLFDSSSAKSLKKNIKLKYTIKKISPINMDLFDVVFGLEAEIATAIMIKIKRDIDCDILKFNSIKPCLEESDNNSKIFLDSNFSELLCLTESSTYSELS